MLARRLPIGLLLPVGLVVLVAALAVLQYRWLGQVSEAEREDLSRSLNERAREFADDFDLEISRAYLAFQLGDDPVTPTATDGIERRLASWRAVARYPDLISTIYFADALDDRYALSRYDIDQSRWEPAEWPAALEAVRARLTPRVTNTSTAGSAEELSIITLSTSPLVAEIPALVVPVATAPEAGTSPTRRTFRALESRTTDLLLSFGFGRDFLVVELNRTYLENTVLPAVADRHFAGDASDRYRLAVIDHTGRRLFTRGPSDTTFDEHEADVSMRLLRVRFDLARADIETQSVFRWQSEPEPSSQEGDVPPLRPSGGNVSIVVSRTEEAGRPPMPALPPQAGWQLIVQHSAGSLDAAVARARQRNLWLSFGILSVLAASVGLIVLNARRAQRLASQQMDFVATVSHELRTPLAVIRSAAQNLSAGVVHTADQAKRYGTLIEDEGQRLTDMVEQVLEYSGLSGNRRPPRAAPIDPAALARESAESASERCHEQGVELTIETAPGLPLVAADEGAMRRALGNLIANALKYAADGKWIGVNVTRGGTAARPEVLISVSDRGQGITPDEIAHIFEPFYRGRSAIERQIHGNGLGLSLVRRIAEAHGGRVTAASSPGAGTTFTLRLPGIEPDPSRQPMAGTTARADHHA